MDSHRVKDHMNYHDLKSIYTLACANVIAKEIEDGMWGKDVKNRLLNQKERKQKNEKAKSKSS